MSIYSAFAAVLEYPENDLDLRVDQCLAGVADRSPGHSPLPGREALRQFRLFVDTATCATLQEVYTAAFDLRTDCTLYVGHHLFGEDGRRSLFLCHLAGLYLEAGMAAGGGEAPDHLGVMLRYLDRDIDAGARAELLREAIVPAATKVADALARLEHPYAPLLRALVEAAGALAAADADRPACGGPTGETAAV